MMQSAKETARQLAIHPGSLANWRVQGRGPRFFKIGSKVMYDRAEVQAWLESQRCTSTSQAA